jgi:hypothetical protein
MKVHIVGVQGNMGHRYWALMKYIESLKPHVKTTGSDIGEPVPLDKDRYIICTPTENHNEMIQYLLYETKGQVLCEKPISKKPEDIDELNSLDAKELDRLRMVNQYRYIHKPLHRDGFKTVYSFFNSGKDGIAWDCINLLGLAQGEVSLSNSSPFWICELNGYRLNRNDVDEAYFHMLWAWFKGQSEDDWKYIVHAHNKVHQWHTL